MGRCVLQCTLKIMKLEGEYREQGSLISAARTVSIMCSGSVQTRTGSRIKFLEGINVAMGKRNTIGCLSLISYTQSQLIENRENG